MIRPLSCLALTLGMLALVAFTTPGVGRAQGKKNLKELRVQLFEDFDFQGRSIVVHKDVPALDKRDFNDTLSSMKWNVPQGTGIVLYVDNEFQNPLAVLVGTGELANFDKFPDANDTVSSLAFLPLGKNGNPKGLKKLPRLGSE